MILGISDAHRIVTCEAGFRVPLGKGEVYRARDTKLEREVVRLRIATAQRTSLRENASR